MKRARLGETPGGGDGGGGDADMVNDDVSGDTVTRARSY